MIDSSTPFGVKAATVHAALEAGGTSWILAAGDPADASRTGLHRLAPHDVAGLLAKLGQARTRAAAVSGDDVRVMPVCEAGYEGFRLARRLEGEDLEVVVCDPASLEVVRRKRRAKTDRIDARKTVRAPVARDGGDRDAMSPVRVPTVAEEDAKRLPGRRERLVKERLRLASAVAGLLRLHGVPPGDPAKAGFRERLGGMRTGHGAALPPGLLAETAGIPGRLEPGVAETEAVEAEKAATLKSAREAARAAKAATPAGPAREADTPPGAAPAEVPGHARHAATLVRLRGIGPNDALLPGAELLCRDFRNRRELAGMAGLAPVPWASGAVDHDQGTGKAGSPMLRKHLVQMAWRWLRHQPRSALSKWSGRCAVARDGRPGKRGIVALARKLLVAPGGSPRPGWCPRAPSCRRPEGGDRNTETPRHPGGPTGPPGNPGKACDRREAWFAASRGTVRPDGSRLPERRTARTGHRGHGAGTGRQTEPDKSLDAPLSVGRAEEPRRSAWRIPERRRAALARRRIDVTRHEESA